jgi:hypothetical protein
MRIEMGAGYGLGNKGKSSRIDWKSREKVMNSGDERRLETACAHILHGTLDIDTRKLATNEDASWGRPK